MDGERREVGREERDGEWMEREGREKEDSREKSKRRESKVFPAYPVASRKVLNY